MNRAPVQGDVLSIDSKELVVVSHHRTPELTYLFETIKRSDMGKVNPKKQIWQLHGGPVLATVTPLSSIVFHEQIKLKIKVETTYTEK